MAHEFGLAVLAQHRAELLTAQQLEGAHAAAAAAGAVEAQALAGLGLLQGERIKVGEDILQQQMELIGAGGQTAREALDLPAALLQQGHQGRLLGRLGQHLHQHAAGAAHAIAADLLTHEQGRRGLFGMEQIGGHVITDAAAHQLHRAAEWLTLADVAHHVQIAGAGGAAEIELGHPGWIGHQIQFQARIPHIAAHRAIPSGIHHQPP